MNDPAWPRPLESDEFLAGDRIESPGTVTFIIPILNDWMVASTLLRSLEPHAPPGARVLLVDDGSTEPLAPQDFRFEMRHIRRIEVLHLGRNFGHQRAIAIGLCYLVNECSGSRVVIMDGDGEDAPQDVPKLLAVLGARTSPMVVFAGRMRRSESLKFRVGYQIFRFVHRLLTGISVRVGNFSVLNHAAARQLTLSPDLWNHYAATAFRLRIPREIVPTQRGHRLAGKSHMNLVGLVTHGLSAISVFREIVCTRLLIVTSLLLALLLGCMLATLGIRFGTNLAIPGWATTAAGLLAAMVLQLLTLVAVIAFSLLGNRAVATIIPIRDTAIFIDHIRLLATAPADDEAIQSEVKQP